jgi:aerobic-type carbon monoxide dehydrogenase small subunit (CoxS/CutS family)
LYNPRSPATVGCDRDTRFKRHPGADKIGTQKCGTNRRNLNVVRTAHHFETEDKMAEELKIRINGQESSVAADRDTPLLYVLANELRLQGPRFGCGLAQCGSCSVLLDGVEIRSCITPVGAVVGKSVTTLEGLPALYARQRNMANPPALHPLQQALIEEQAPQCGYCYNGMIIKGFELLANNAQPNEREIREAMNGHLCRCGSYPRVMKAIQLASRLIAEERK